MEVDDVTTSENFSEREISLYPSVESNQCNDDAMEKFIEKVRCMFNFNSKNNRTIDNDDLKRCIAFVEAYPMEEAIYESLRTLKTQLPCPHLNCDHMLKRSRGAEGKSILTLSLTCPQHDKIMAPILLFGLPDIVLNQIYRKFRADAIISFCEKTNILDPSAIQGLKGLFDSEVGTVAKGAKQTSITDFMSQTASMMEPDINNQNEVLKKTNLSISESANNCTSIQEALKKVIEYNSNDPMIILLTTICQTLIESNNEMKKEMSILIQEMKSLKEERTSNSLNQQVQASFPYLEATAKGSFKAANSSTRKISPKHIDMKSQITTEEISIALRKTSPRSHQVEQLKTIHIKGFARCQIGLIKKIFLTAEINLFKIKDISFIGNQVMELIVLENYENEFMTKLKSLEVKPEFKGLFVEKINFDPLENENFKSPISKDLDPETKFRERMKKKLERLKARVESTPSLRQTVRYVERQVETNSYISAVRDNGKDEEVRNTIPDHSVQALQSAQSTVTSNEQLPDPENKSNEFVFEESTNLSEEMDTL